MSDRFDELVRLMARLRAPGGCPWDRKQTHQSLKPYLLEETYEVLETIDRQESPKLKEELGDLLLQIFFHSQIGLEEGTFDIEGVMDLLAQKLVRRHPHVFDTQTSDGEGPNAEQVYARWEQIKREERHRAGHEGSALDGIPRVLPALLRAYQVQARASRVGFDWPHTAQGLANVLGKIDEELKELQEVLPPSPDATVSDTPTHGHDRVEAELGDLLFSLVNLARVLKVNPEDSLRQATNQFVDRFHYIETEAAKAGRRVQDLSLDEMDRLWEQAKAIRTAGLSPSQGTS